MQQLFGGKDTTMTTPAILGLATGVPAYQHRQMDIHDRWLRPYINSERARAIFAAAEIDTRYSVLPDSTFLAGEPGTKARNNLYMQTARTLGKEVIQQALARASLEVTEVDHFLVVSCTGFDCPGLDVILAGELGMQSNLRRSALIGMGCHAGLTGLDRAVIELTARPQHHALLLAVEFGTLHFQHGRGLDDMVASALFGDGLAAVVLGSERRQGRQPRVQATMTYTDYAARDLMGFYISDTGYQIQLATRVPKVLKALVPEVVYNFLEQAECRPADIRFWGIHPGGARIVDYIGEALALPQEALTYSRQVMRQYGNMSSVTIFFVLDRIIQEGQPQSGDRAVLLGFGPGLTIELALLAW